MFEYETDIRTDMDEPEPEKETEEVEGLAEGADDPDVEVMDDEDNL